MKRLKLFVFGTLTVVWLLALPSYASASYGIASFDARIDADPTGDLAFTQAGGHPYEIGTHIEWNHHLDEEGLPTPDGDLKTSVGDLPPGVVGNPTTVPSCTAAELDHGNALSESSECPVSAQVGTIRIRFNFTDSYVESTGHGAGTYPIFNMVAPAGSAARFGFKVLGVPLYLDAELRQGDYGITIGTHDIPEALRTIAADVVFWGEPADESHDFQRCNYAGFGFDLEEGCGVLPAMQGNEPSGAGAFHSDAPDAAFLTLSTKCTVSGEGQEWTLRSDSWEQPGVFSVASVFSHRPPYAPEPPGARQGPEGCDRVPFSPDFSAQATQHSAASASGLNIHLAFPSEGLLNPEGVAQSHLRKAVVKLPEGMQINPSQAEGLGVCGPAEYAAASVDSYGCSATAKIGTVEVKSPLLEETVPGNVYVAKPYDNPSHSLIALYIVLREPQRGIAVKIPGKVAPDPNTGQITATFDELPQLPFESFDFKFREGPRAPLITPRTCGAYATTADFYPWARPDTPVHTVSTFQIGSGVGGGPCPSSGTPPFHPGFSAGTENNAAGTYSPFLMRLTRADGEQDLTKFSAVLPPGVSAKIARVAKCPDAAISLAGEKSGTEERESPSCPQSSKIGQVIAGAGVGSTLVYVPGNLYLAGPYNGAPLSAVAIVPAVAGPFDVGDVVTRVALSLDPRTGEVHVDGERSDPIPHILAGIPLSVREIHVSTDRPQFTLNPTSCDPSQVQATLWGSNADLLSPADDQPVALSQRFQAASCASLGFKPRLRLLLRGSTPRRGGHPALRGVFLPHRGDANLQRLVLRLPHSAFLEQAHIRTICTRVQFAAGGGDGRGCPKGAVYGHVKAWTPLLGRPLEGPVFLRSSNHNLPDFVAALHGVVDIEAVARIDSVHGGIRATFTRVPDAPLSRVVVNMQGAKKGLIVNSKNLCVKPGGNRAVAAFAAHNGKSAKGRPVVRAVQCRKMRHKRHRVHRRKG